MEFALGPCPADDMVAWTRMARRILVECSGPAEAVSNDRDRLAAWSHLIEAWSVRANQSAANDQVFRWTEPMEPEVAEFLLHGIDQVVNSRRLTTWITDEEAERYRPTTTMVVHAFTEALRCEGPGCRHFADEILSSLGNRLVA